MTTSVMQKCLETLRAYFEKHPVTEAPVLESFTPPPDALLQPLFRPTVSVPCNPEPKAPGTFPSLLLHDLLNAKCKSKAVYQFVEKTKLVRPAALYGTSGAGKTRSIFE